MKRVLLILSLLLLSACEINTEVLVDIGKNKTVEVTYAVTVDKEFLESMLQFGDEYNLYNLENDEDYIELYKSVFGDDERVSVKMDGDRITGTTTAIKDSLDALSAYDADIRVDVSSITDDISYTPILFIRDGDTYSSNMLVSEYNIADFQDLIESGVDVEYKVVINFPNKPLSSNATYVSEDGLTLTWDFIETSEENIDFTFEMNKSSFNYLYIVIGLLLLGIIAYFLLKKNSNKDNNQEFKDLASLKDNSK